MKRKPSIIRGLLILAVVVAMISAAASLFYFERVIGARLKDLAEQTVDAAAHQMADSLSGKMIALNNVAYYLMASDLAQQVMYDGEGQMAVSQLERQIDAMMTYNDAWSRRFIQSLYLFRKDGTVFATMRESVYAGVRERNRAVYLAYEDFSSTRVLLRPPGSSYCYYLQDYYQIDMQQKLGKLVIEINPAGLLGDAPLTALPEGSFAVLREAEGEALHTLGEVPKEPPALEKFHHISLAVGKYSMHLDVYAPYSGILRPLSDSRTAFYVMHLVILLIIIALIMLISALMRPHSENLRKNLERLAGGDFSVRLPASRFRENDLTARAFNHATDQLGSLFTQISETGSLLGQAEYQMLESQINPHFIMNVLETINMQCLLAGRRETSELVVNLGKLLQSNVVMKSQQKIGLRQELEYVQYYLALQRARFDRLSATLQVEDESLLDCLVPKLTVQPIVENSFVHGLEDSRKDGVVDISIWEEDLALLIRVRDNGMGFDVSSWRQLEPSTDAGQAGRGGVALRNIQRRIELLYGTSFGLSVNSTIGEGTTILITLPLERPQMKEEEGAAYA
ncbi:MAG: sensor histidine kinase [Christensenellales bacterium]